MEVPLEEEINAEIARLRLRLVGLNVMDGCSGARNAVDDPSKQNSKRLGASTYWEVSDLYKYDILAADIPRIARQLAYGIAQASLYLPHVEYSIPINRGMGHALFWYHIDFSTRLASSGWDRLSLLLDLVFNTGLIHQCNFPKVLRQLAICFPVVRDAQPFKRLTAFRDGPFQELEAKRGEGMRHEATHIITPSIRELFLCLEDLRESSDSADNQTCKRKSRKFNPASFTLQQGN